MIAVIKTGSKQYKVKEKQILHVEKLDVSKGDEITFDQVLLVSDASGTATKIGMPIVKDAKVTAKVIDQVRMHKVTGIKFKNKISYRRKFGHRQPMTKVQITKIVA